MKTLKFAPDLVTTILAGQKTITWRFFDDKDLSEGDIVTFLSADSGLAFATARINGVAIKSLSTISLEDRAAHGEEGTAAEKLCQRFTAMYHQPVGPETPMKIVSFILLDTGQATE